MVKPNFRNLVMAAAIFGTVVFGIASGQAADESAPGAVKTFTLVSVMVDDAKIWLPSSITVEQGDHVKLTLKNLIPGAANQHGFSIPDYGITEVVTRGEPKTVEFVADKPGVFPYICQLHPAHIGGQLLVMHKMMGHHAAAK